MQTEQQSMGNGLPLTIPNYVMGIRNYIASLLDEIPVKEDEN